METRPFDPVEYLDTEETIAAYLADARAYGGQEISDAIVVVGRARATMRTSQPVSTSAARSTRRRGA